MFGFFSKAESTAPAEPNPPARSDRKKCWEARDKYYECLDDAGVLVPGEEAGKCSSQVKAFERDCAKSWVAYFNQRRVLAEQQKESLKMADNQAEEARRRAATR